VTGSRQTSSPPRTTFARPASGLEGGQFGERSGVVVTMSAADSERGLHAQQSAHAVPLDFEGPLLIRWQDGCGDDKHRGDYGTNTAINGAGTAVGPRGKCQRHQRGNGGRGSP
jgi:hypothetical protein